MINRIKQVFSNDIHFKEILSGASLSFIARGFSIILGLIVNFIMARYYGADVIGILAIINSFLSVAIMFSLVGTHVAILRLIPEYIAKYSFNAAYRVYKKITKLITITSLIIIGVLYILVNPISIYIFDKPYINELLIFSLWFIYVQSMITIDTRVLRTLKEFKLFAIFQVFPSFVNLCLLLSMTFLYYHKYNPVYSQFLSYIIEAIALYIIVKKLFVRKIDRSELVEEPHIRSILKMSFPMFLSTGMTVIISQTDTLMLGSMATEKEVGIYAVVFKLALLTTFIHTAVNTIAAPKFSELFHSGDMGTLRVIATKTSKLIFFMTLPISLVIILFGKNILVLFGKEFESGIYALVILAIGQLFGAVFGLVGTFLNMTGYEKTFRNIVFISGLTNIILNYILIPEFGLNGAAFASMISIIMWNIISFYMIYKKFNYFIAYFPFFLRYKD